MWDNGAADYYGIKKGDEFSSARIEESIASLFNTAQNYIPPRYDPLILDLDGDGVETVGVSSTKPIYFDLDGDGIKTGTAWVKSDDGFLVMDRNNNGTIDNGAELFGDVTLLATGGKAADGFAALTQEDSNHDGKIDSLQDVLKFKTHDITTRCYSASSARIVYMGTLHMPCREKIAREKTLEDDESFAGNASGTYPAFGSPVQVEWRSRDGEHHSAVLNLNDIFKERIVLHKEDPERIYKPMPITGGVPTIIVEINNRKLNVYMDVDIQLISADPHAVRRDVHNNRTLAYTKIF